MSGQFGPVTADPVGLGRRIAGRVINAAIGVAIYAIMFLPLGETAATGYIRQPAWAAVLIAVVVFTATVERSTSDICHSGLNSNVKSSGSGSPNSERCSTSNSKRM